MGEETKSLGAEGSTGAGDGMKNCGAEGAAAVATGVVAANSGAGRGLFVELILMLPGLT